MNPDALFGFLESANERPAAFSRYTARDLWTGEDAGTAKGTFSRIIEPHGAGLYRFSRVPGSSTAWEPVKDW